MYMCVNGKEAKKHIYNSYQLYVERFPYLRSKFRIYLRDSSQQSLFVFQQYAGVVLTLAELIK